MYLTSAFGSQVEQSGALRLHRKDHNFRRSGSPSVGNRKKRADELAAYVVFLQMP